MTGESGMAAEVGDAVADVLRAAYHNALVDGHRLVEPALLVVAAARNDDVLARPVLGAAVADARSWLASHGGESAPAELRERWYGAALREAGWWVFRGAAEGERAGGGPIWTSALCLALDRAAGAAEVGGGVLLAMSDLLVGLLDPPDKSARALLASLDLDPAALVTEVRARRPAAAPRPLTRTPSGDVSDQHMRDSL